MQKREHFDFEHIRLLPKLGIVESRDECDTSVIFGKHKFKNCVIPANMLATINEDLCIKLAKAGYMYIHHRFNHDNIAFIRKMNELGLMTSISVGVKQESFEQLKQIKNENLKVDFICIDIAHGHSILLERVIKFIKDIGLDSFVIGGNICTEQAIIDLTSWGCDALKLNIGNGSACTTFDTVHMGTKGLTASCVYNLSKVSSLPVICDGGIKSLGHISAAYSLGASMIMVGGIMSNFKDSPGHIVTENGKHYKEFFGSASEFTKGHKKYVEGRKYLHEMKNAELLEFMEDNVNQAIKSAISYAGGKNMDALRAVDFIFV